MSDIINPANPAYTLVIHPKSTSSRPLPGSITIQERRIPVCKHCNCIVTDGLCAWDCIKDTNHSPDDIFNAVYKVTWEFMRDEEIQADSNEEVIE